MLSLSLLPNRKRHTISRRWVFVWYNSAFFGPEFFNFKKQKMSATFLSLINHSSTLHYFLVIVPFRCKQMVRQRNTKQSKVLTQIPNNERQPLSNEPSFGLSLPQINCTYIIMWQFYIIARPFRFSPKIWVIVALFPSFEVRIHPSVHPCMLGGGGEGQNVLWLLFLYVSWP